MRTLPFALGLLLTITGLASIPNVAATDVVEGFETYGNGKLPCTTPTTSSPCTNSYSTYSSLGSGGFQVQSTHFDTGSKAFQVLAASGQAADGQFATSSDLCGSGNGVSFAIAASANTMAPAFVQITSFPNVAGGGVGDVTHSGVNYQLTFNAATVGTSANVFLSRVSYSHTVATTVSTATLTYTTSFALNTFYHFLISCQPGPNSGPFSISSDEATALGNPPQGAVGGGNVGADFSPAKYLLLGGFSNAESYYFDNLLFAVSAATPTVGAAATTTNTMALSGFDVDPMRRVVIARESVAGPASKIDTFDPDTLALQGASPLSNACNKIDGVMAWNTQPSDTRGYAGFLDCTVSSTQSNFLKIRSPLLGDPDQSGTLCEGTNPNFCDFDLQTQTGGDVCPGATTNSLPGGSTSIANIAAAPISWTNGQTETDVVNVDNVLIGFAFSDTGNGNIGLWAIQQNHNEPDESCGVSTPFGGPSATKQICTWRSGDGHDYLTAVSDSVSAITWRTDVDRTARDIFAPNSFTQPNVVMTQVYPHQSPFNMNVGVACADNYNYVLTSSGTVASVKVLGTSLGARWNTPGAFAYERGIAVSRDNLRVAYTSDATHVTIANATTGTVLGTVVMPTGVFKEMRLDDAANNLYIATSTKISRYDLAGANAGINSGNPNGVRGSGNNQCTINASGVCTGTGSSTATNAPGSFFGLNPGAFDPSGQGDQTKGGFFLSMLLILGFAAVGAGLLPTTKVSGMIFGAGLGALLGFAWTVFLGVMPPIITFILIVVGAASIGLKRLVASRSGSDA